jgi:hypothetical protein
MQKQTTWRGSLLLVVTLSVGVSIVWGVAVNWTEGVLSQFQPRERIYRDIVVRIDGEPLVQTRWGRYQMQYRHETLDGKPFDVKRDQLWTLEGAYLSAPSRPRLFHVQPPWKERLVSFHDGQRSPAFWYFIDDGNLRGRGYFVGYDSETKSLAGYLTPDGFSRGKPAGNAGFQLDRRVTASPPLAGGFYHFRDGREPRYYESSGGQGYIASWVRHVVTADGLYRVDLNRRSVEKVVEDNTLVAADLAAIAVSAPDVALRSNRLPTRQLVAIRNQEAIRLVDPEGSSNESFVLPTQLRESKVDFYRTGENKALAITTTNRRRTSSQEKHLYWLTEDGKVTRQERIAFARNYRSNTPLGSLVAGLAVPVPVGWAANTFAVTPASLMWEGEASGYGDALGWSLSQHWCALLVTVALTAMSVWHGVRRQRQYAAPWTAMWVTLIILFGPAALLAYLVHRPWAARRTCPACDQPAPRDRESCLACREPFPEPAPRGIEVFAA